MLPTDVIFAACYNVFLSWEQFIFFLLSQFRFGMVKLLPVAEPTKVIKELISYGLERSTHLQAKTDNMHKENQRLRNEQEHITAG